jgi:hypothetical protein
MDHPEQPGKLRWFSPPRWRFWVWMAPVLGISSILFLFCWPGLRYYWYGSDNYYLSRVDTFDDADHAIFRVGPLCLFKFTMEGAEPFTAGSDTKNGSRFWSITWTSSHTQVGFDFVKEWRPFE